MPTSQAMTDLKYGIRSARLDWRVLVRTHATLPPTASAQPSGETDIGKRCYLIVATVLLAVGAVAMIGGLAMMGWDISNLHSVGANMEGFMSQGNR